jgi:hypothetical protein
MRAYLGYLPVFVVLLLGLLLALFSRPLTRWVKSNRDAYNGAVIGSVPHAEGSVRRLHGQDIEIIPMLTAWELHDGDSLQVSVGSKAVVELVSGFHFDMPEGSGVQLNLAVPGNPSSPIYIRVQLGQIIPTATATQLTYVIQDGQLNYAGDPPTVPPVAAKPVSAIQPETLSEDFVKATLKLHQAELAKCKTTGAVAATLELKNDGTVKTVVFSGSNDGDLLGCLTGAIGSVVFHPFTGKSPVYKLSIAAG